MGQALNLKNQRFGALVAIQKLPSKNKKTYWLCLCDCGNYTEVQTGHLTSGAIQSCGCHCNISKKNPITICPICNSSFTSTNGSRKYCYNCIPQGLTQTEQLRYKKRAIKHELVAYKGGKCELCGYNKMECALQFHHKNPEEKEFNLSHINLNNTTITMDMLKQEVDKCQLLCANCHFEQHYYLELQNTQEE